LGILLSPEPTKVPPVSDRRELSLPTPAAIILENRARPAAAIYRASQPTMVVTPTYNETANLPELVRRFFQHVENVELLVVDDQSPDGTAQLCEELMQTYPGLRLLRRKGPRGLGRAYVAGLTCALENGYEVIGTMDADLSHDPAYLPLMLTLLEGNDVVVGSRYIHDGGTVNWPVRRILLSWTANRYAGKLLGIGAHDLTSGFRLYRRAALQRLRPQEVRSTGYSFLVELLYRAHRSGAKIAESPIIFYDRAVGASKLGRREIYLGAWHLLTLRLRPPDVGRPNDRRMETRIDA
jgi:dolichol-phosphate mannosyltransferase